MTTSRIVRGTKARAFLYIAAVLMITGVIACYNNTLSQLDDVKKSFESCHQEQENLATQLQMISDYKQRLEKSLKTEKAEHQQALNELRSKMNDEQAKNEKSSSDAKMKFSSLQQHYNLLQTQHDDLKEKCSDIQQQQLTEINNLQSKLKELQEQSKRLEINLKNSKTEYTQLLQVKKDLEEELKNKNFINNKSSQNEVSYLMILNEDLRKEVQQLKETCDSKLKRPDVYGRQKGNFSKSTQSSLTFTKQVQVDKSAYQIRDDTNKPVDANVADQPPAEKRVNESPVNNSKNVLASPDNNLIITSPSPSKVSKASLAGAKPLKLPTVTPESAKSKVSKEVLNNQNMRVLPMPYQFNKVPDGVVPIPDKKHEAEDKSAIANDVNEALPNRYRNNIIDNELEKESQNLKNGGKNEETDKENVANEVYDQNNDKNYDNLGFADVNDPIKHAEKQKFDKHHIDALSIGNEKANAGHLLKLADGQNDPDYDKIQNDVQAEENDPEEDDDAEDYGDHIARQKDPAVRN